MAPASNHKQSRETMNDTFFLSNVSPQVEQQSPPPQHWLATITGPLFFFFHVQIAHTHAARVPTLGF
jgi:hypothetical protein